eukprot:2954124-Prymnesium_polylepis.1
MISRRCATSAAIAASAPGASRSAPKCGNGRLTVVSQRLPGSSAVAAGAGAVARWESAMPTIAPRPRVKSFDTGLRRVTHTHTGLLGLLADGRCCRRRRYRVTTRAL